MNPEKNWKLVPKIIKRSIAEEWSAAKTEWEVEQIMYGEECSCLCGKFPIKKVNLMRNKYTNEEVEVGRCCVKKFNMEGGFMYDNILKVFADLRKSVGIDVLERAKVDGIIRQNEYDFYSDTVRKRVLTDKQEKWRIDINRKIVARYT